MAAGSGLNFIGGLSEGLQEKEASGEHIVKKTNMRNALLYGAGNAALELSKETMSGLKNKAPSFKVPAGKEIIVIFSGKN